MPVTITRPDTERIFSTAATKGPPRPSAMAAESAAIPADTVSSVRRADRISSESASFPSVFRLFGLATRNSPEPAAFLAWGVGGKPIGDWGQGTVNHARFTFVNHKQRENPVR